MARAARTWARLPLPARAVLAVTVPLGLLALFVEWWFYAGYEYPWPED